MGKQIHVVDGYVEGVYQRFPQDKPDDQYQEAQKRIRNASLSDVLCESDSIQMMVWNSEDAST